MGACCFHQRVPRRASRTVRVVHLDGFIEEYETPATVNQVINIHPKHFMTTPIRLMQIGLIPLKLDTQLEPGRIYFVLPCTFIRFNESSKDLFPLTRKLTNIAKTHQFKPKPAVSANPQNKHSSQISLVNKLTNVAKTRGSNDQTTSSASKQRKRSRQNSREANLTTVAIPEDKASSETSDDHSNDRRVNKTNPNRIWKPLLSTIREMSFNRRESDVRD